MKITSKAALKTAFIVGGVVASVGIATAATTALRWSLNGKVVSSNVRVIGGQAYVPLADVARAMNLKVVKTGAMYAVQPAGGATQVNGIRQGKVGEQVFSGKWSLLVESVREVEEYDEQYSNDGRKLTPKNPGDKLVVIEAWIRNGVQKSQTPVLTERMAGNTSLADTNGQSYAPIDFDARQESGKYSSYAAATLLPAARMKFALVFSVPQETQAKALVFTFLNYPGDVGGKGADVRVLLQ